MSSIFLDTLHSRMEAVLNKNWFYSEDAKRDIHYRVEPDSIGVSVYLRPIDFAGLPENEPKLFSIRVAAEERNNAVASAERYFQERGFKHKPTETLIDRLRAGTARITGGNPEFRKTADLATLPQDGSSRLRGFYSVQKALFTSKNLAVVLKPMGSIQHPGNKSERFTIPLSQSEKSNLPAVVGEVVHYFEERLGFYPLQEPCVRKSFSDQLRAFFAETVQKVTVREGKKTIVPAPQFTIEGENRRVGYYSVNTYAVPSLDGNPAPAGIVRRNIEVSLVSLVAGNPTAKIRSVLAATKSEIDATVKDSRAFLEGQGFRSSPYGKKPLVKRPLTPKILEDKILLGLEALKKDAPDIFEAGTGRFRGTFTIFISHDRDGKNANIAIQIHPPSDEIASRENYARNPRSIHNNVSTLAKITPKQMADHATEFMKGLGFENRELITFYNYDRSIDKSNIDLDAVKVLPSDGKKNYRIQIVPPVKQRLGLFISVKSNSLEEAEKCLGILKTPDGLPRMIAEAAPISENSILDYLQRNGAAKAKPYRKVTLYGQGDELHGYLFITANIAVKNTVAITFSPSADPMRIPYKETRKLFFHTATPNTDERLGRIMHISRLILDDFCDTGLGFTRLAEEPARKAGVISAHALLGDPLRTARRLSLEVKTLETPMPDGQCVLQIIPRRDFNDPLPREEFPDAPLIFRAASSDAVKSFEIAAHRKIHDRLKRIHLPRKKYVPDPQLISECVEGAIAEGLERGLISELPEDSSAARMALPRPDGAVRSPQVA